MGKGPHAQAASKEGDTHGAADQLCEQERCTAEEQALGCEAGRSTETPPEHPQKEQGKNQHEDGAKGKHPATETIHK